MFHKPLIVLSSLFFVCSCMQTNRNVEQVDSMTIDPKIKTQAEKNIEDFAEFDAFRGFMEVYNTSFLIDSYENDSSVMFNNDPRKKNLFKSFYHWINDTLTIEGSFGLFGGGGFSLKIKDDEATLYHLISSEDFPSYAYTAKSPLEDRLEVPCTNTRIVLSEIPDSVNVQLVYGYVEFKSTEFYSLDTENDRRIKKRNNMKIYFRSSFLDLDAKKKN